MSEQEIEQEIQDKGLNAPRLRPADIDVVIVGETYTVLPSGKAMVCELTLRSGFTVRGESACVSKENFNEEIGRKVAREDARNKVWQLEGYRLQCDLARIAHDPIMEAARLAHEVIRAYCQALGDGSQLPWDEAPQWVKDSSVAGVHFHMVNPGAGPEASHEAWSDHKLKDGWQYGPVKDAEKKTHPCLVPFTELPVEQQAKDYLFRAVVRAMMGADL